MSSKPNWVYEPKPINIKRGICYGLTDLMGGGWNNIVSGVIFAFVLSQGISPAFVGLLPASAEFLMLYFHCFSAVSPMDFTGRDWGNDLAAGTFSSY